MADQIQIAELNIKFTGDTADLTKGSQRAQAIVTASFGKIDKSADGVAASTAKVDKSFGKLDTSAVSLAARIQIMQNAYGEFRRVLRGAIDIAKLGGQSLRVEQRFRAFAGTIGDSTELLAAFQRGAGGTVNKLVAMNNAALLIQQGLVKTDAEMEKTVELATRLGDQTLVAKDRLQFFSQLLRNQSIRLLDNFGISSGVVRRRIKELQEATAGLSREEAFRIAVFEEGQKALDVLGERQDDYASKLERAQARMENFRIEMGERVVPILAVGAEFISKLDSVTILLVTTLTSAVGIAAKFSGGLSGLISKLGMTGGQFGFVVASVAALIAAYEGVRRVQKALEEGQAKVNEALAAWPKAVEKAIGEGEALEDEVVRLSDAINKANAEFHKNGNVIEDLAVAYARSTSEVDTMEAAANKVRLAIIQQADSIEEANGLIATYNARVENAHAKLEQFTDETWASIEAFDAFASSANAINTVMGAIGLGGTIPDLREELDKYRQEQEENAQAAEVLENKTISLSDAISIAQSRLREHPQLLDQIKIRLGEVTAEEVKARNDLELYARALDAGTVSQDEFTQAVIAASEGTLDLSFAERKALTEALNHKAALDEYRDSLEKTREEEEKRLQVIKDQTFAQIEQAEALMDASAQDVARAAIKRLTEEAQKSDADFEKYAEAIVGIQDQFGLADAESRALTLGLGALVNEFTAGNLAANEFDDALLLLIEDAKDGEVNMAKLVEQARLFNEMILKSSEGVNIFDASVGEFYTTMSEMPDFEETMASAMGGERIINMAGGGAGAEAIPAGERIIDAMTGEMVRATRERGPSMGGGGVTIYGDIRLEGVEDAADFLRQLMALME